MRPPEPPMSAPLRSHPSASRSQHESGQVIVLLVVTLAVLLGAAAMTIDVGYAYYTHRSLQADADAAALAGAAGLPDTNAAKSLAAQYSGTSGSKNSHANIPSVDTNVSLECLGTGCTTTNAVHVVEHATVNTFFAKILGIKTFNVTASSTACSPGFGTASLVDNGATTCPTPPNPGPCVLGYPFSSSNPNTNVQFNESEVLRTFAPTTAGPNDTIKVWYNDEHALTLGINQLQIKQKVGSTVTTTTTNYPFSTLGAVPSSVTNPAVGSTALSGDPAALDSVGRPEFPALFITDRTTNASNRSGDWQFGGTPIRPDAVYGTWKGAVKLIDKTKTPAQTTVTPGADPTKNNWNLGTGSDTVPSGQTNEGYGAEATWKVSSLGLLPGHIYRIQFMVHDGDQHSTGGDVGEACMHVVIPG
jgi:Flp pilus assembly protein TadG